MATTQLRVSPPVAPHPTSVNAQLALERVSMALKTHFDLRSTPGVLRALQVACLVLIGLGFWAEWSYCDHLQAVVKTIQKDSVPSIVAAEELRKDLADANANAVNALLPGQSSQHSYWDDFRQSMRQAHQQLVKAAENITYDDEERLPILELSNYLASYEQMLGEVRGRLESKGAEDNAFHAETLMRINKASKVMSDDVLAQASRLGDVNYQHLSTAYAGFIGNSDGLLAPSVLCVALLFFFLTLAQWYLFRTTHRIINPGLAAATVVSVALGIYGLQVFYHEVNSLQVAYKDAFTSVHALRKAQSVAYDANAQESLYLLNEDPAEKRKNDAAFTVDSDKIWNAKTTPGQEPPFLNAELANITFDGEREAALKCVDAWRNYFQIDQVIRSLERKNQHAAAIKLNLGVGLDQSNGAFDAFNDALNGTIKINKEQFDLKMDAAKSRLDLFPVWTGLAALLMAGAVILGLKPRLDEYRF